MAAKAGKIRAGRILNTLLRKISEEPTEFWTDITEGGDDRFITKAEAMVRTVYKLALGYKEEREREGENGNVIKYTAYVAPDRHMLAMIWDRLEGRVGTSEELNERKAKIADRVSEQGARRIAAAGGVADAGSSGDKTKA